MSRAAARGRPSRATSTTSPTRPDGAAPTRRLGRLSTGRIAVLVLVAVTLLVSAALPLREFLSQRGEIAELAAANAAASERVEQLAAARQELDDPDHIAAEARRRLHFVLPGETAYIVLPPEPADEPDPAEDLPWYSQLWRSVGEADRPVAAPAQ